MAINNYKHIILGDFNTKLELKEDYIVISQKDNEDIKIKYEYVYEVNSKEPSMLSNGFIQVNQYNIAYSDKSKNNDLWDAVNILKSNMMSQDEIAQMKAEEARVKMEQEKAQQQRIADQKAAEEKMLKEAMVARQKALEKINEFKKNNMLTTGYSFDGYTIKEYKGVISGDVVIGTGIFTEVGGAFADIFGATSSKFSQKMKFAKLKAQEELMLNALEMSANAIIGIDIDYQVLGNNMIAVSMNGTAVVIEKDK